MGLSIRKKVLLRQEVKKICKACKLMYSEDKNFCSQCGTKLATESTKVYANVSDKGVTSISYKMPDGTTINSKGNISKSLGNGLSYKTSLKKDNS